MRILIAPHEICGQMQLLADGLRRHGCEATAAALDDPSVFQYQTDICLNLGPNTSWSRKLFARTRFALWAARHFDVFHFFFGRSLLPKQLDLRLLKTLGKPIVAHFHGTDVRQRKYLWRVVEKQLLNQPVTNPVDRSTKSQQARLARLEEVRGPHVDLHT